MNLIQSQNWHRIFRSLLELQLAVLWFCVLASHALVTDMSFLPRDPSYHASFPIWSLILCVSTDVDSGVKVQVYCGLGAIREYILLLPSNCSLDFPFPPPPDTKLLARLDKSRSRGGSISSLMLGIKNPSVY